MKIVSFLRSKAALAFAALLAVLMPAAAFAQTATSAYETLISAMVSEVQDFQNNFAIPATVALLGLIAVLTAIRWVRGMFRAAA